MLINNQNRIVNIPPVHSFGLKYAPTENEYHGMQAKAHDVLRKNLREFNDPVDFKFPMFSIKERMHPPIPQKG